MSQQPAEKQKCKFPKVVPLAMIVLVLGALVFFQARPFSIAAFDIFSTKLLLVMNNMNSGKQWSDDGWEEQYLSTVWLTFQGKFEPANQNDANIQWWRQRLLPPEVFDAMNEITKTQGTQEDLIKLKRESKNPLVVKWALKQSHDASAQEHDEPKN